MQFVREGIRDSSVITDVDFVTCAVWISPASSSTPSPNKQFGTLVSTWDCYFSPNNKFVEICPALGLVKLLDNFTLVFGNVLKTTHESSTLTIDSSLI